MVCLGLEPRAAEWKDQTNPLSNGACPCAVSQWKVDKVFSQQFHWKKFIQTVPGTAEREMTK